MIKKDSPARIPRLGASEWNDEAQDIVDMYSGNNAVLTGAAAINVGENHVLTTFARHPKLTKHFLKFNHFLLTESSIPVRLRQIAIMRVAWLKEGTYIWSSHLRTSLRNQLEEDVFNPIKEGPDSAYWKEDERIVLQAVDEMHNTNRLNDNTWNALAGLFDQLQLMELLFTMGAYSLMSIVSNGIRIEREDELLELADRFGAPDYE